MTHLKLKFDIGSQQISGREQSAVVQKLHAPHHGTACAVHNYFVVRAEAMVCAAAVRYACACCGDEL
jgi:hypothetical protein